MHVKKYTYSGPEDLEEMQLFPYNLILICQAKGDLIILW